MAQLLLDEYGRPMPQYRRADGTAFEALEGEAGAMYVFLKQVAAVSKSQTSGVEKSLPIALVMPGGNIASGDAANGLDVDVTRVSGVVTVKPEADMPVLVKNTEPLNVNVTSEVTVKQKVFNGTTWEEQLSNSEIVVLPSEARTASAQVDVVNNQFRGALVLIDITDVGATPGSITGIEFLAKVGSNYHKLHEVSGLTLNAVGTAAFAVYPETLDAGAYTAAPIKGILPRNWKLLVKHANSTDSITYSVTVSYLQ